METTQTIIEEFEKKCNQEEWGGWKFVSDMLDHPDENGLYPTSKCYEELYDFVVAQKKKALTQQLDELKGKIEGMKSYRFNGCIIHRGNTKDDICDVCLVSNERNSSYNQSLSDILTLIDSMK